MDIDKIIDNYNDKVNLLTGGALYDEDLLKAVGTAKNRKEELLLKVIK